MEWGTPLHEQAAETRGQESQQQGGADWMRCEMANAQFAYSCTVVRNSSMYIIKDLLIIAVISLLSKNPSL
jgi:hypothetical protein